MELLTVGRFTLRGSDEVLSGQWNLYNLYPAWIITPYFSCTKSADLLFL